MTDLTEDFRAAEPIWTRRTAYAAGALAALVVLADILFFNHEPGVSLAIYCLALTGFVLTLHPQKLRDGRTAIMTVVAVLAALPLAESENLFWWPLAMGAVGLLSLQVAGLLPRYEDWFGTVTRFNTLAPVRLIADVWQLFTDAGRQKLGTGLWRLALVWIVPLVCALVFIFLFASANPVIEDALRAIRLDQLLRLLDPVRIFVWGFFAVITWPILMPRLLHWQPVPEVQGPSLPRRESLIFGAIAIRNSLLLFNALFAVQTLLDLMYLWGGVRLPDDVTYAQYAHSAAYPLIITAVLAGAFVLAAMRRNGPAANSPLIRGLVYLWIGQNVWLVISALLRLKLYVETYMLSELRIAAAVWMALVAIGLLLIMARIIFGKSNKWLVMTNLTALALMLYGVSFIDFPATISWFNVTHSSKMGQSDNPLDINYLGQLGPGVLPALDYYLRNQRVVEAGENDHLRLMRLNLAADASWPFEWQRRTLRNDRLRAYLADHPYAPEWAYAKN
jgi:hypothetical protein